MNDGCPRLRPRRSVVGGDLVVDGVRSDTCEAFNQMQGVYARLLRALDPRGWPKKPAAPVF
jgi:hypothetical protein